MAVATPYDAGGWLPEGLRQVVNRFAEPESILTQDEWTLMRDSL